MKGRDQCYETVYRDIPKTAGKLAEAKKRQGKIFPYRFQRSCEKIAQASFFPTFSPLSLSTQLKETVLILHTGVIWHLPHSFPHSQFNWLYVSFLTILSPDIFRSFLFVSMLFSWGLFGITVPLFFLVCKT